jgi:excisionase family DNA binding protein
MAESHPLKDFSTAVTEINETEPLWIIEDVAAYLRLQPETIRTMARKGDLPGMRIGRLWRFQKSIIINYLLNKNKKIYYYGFLKSP